MYLLLGFIIDIWSSTINDPILLLHIYSYFEDIKHFFIHTYYVSSTEHGYMYGQKYLH